MSAIEKYKEFMTQVDWNELSAGEKEALFEATRGVPNPDGIPFRVITDGGRDSDVKIIYDNNDTNPTIDLSHEELVGFHKWLEDTYMDGNAELFNTLEREKEKDAILKNNLNVLFRDMRNVAEEVSRDCKVDVYPIKGTMPVLCFSIFVDSEPLALVFSQDASFLAMHLKLSAYKDISFKYLIQKNSDNEFPVAIAKDYENWQNSTISDINKIQAKIYSYSELLILLKSECKSLNAKVKQTLKTIAEDNEPNRSIPKFLIKISDKVGLTPQYQYTNTNKRFTLSDDDEKEFFRLFFKDGKPIQQVCRYCGLESMFQMLSNQRIRMYGVAGMNDKSEYKYAWDSFFCDKENESEIEKQINRTYLLSCSNISLMDTLEMWRLYGDDGKGACLIFEVLNQEEPFVFGRAVYEYTREKRNKKNDFKWKILKRLTVDLKNLGMQLDFKNQSQWLSFFKSGDYYYEYEVRLVYKEPSDNHKSNQWVLSKSTSVVNPYVEFDLQPKSEGTSFPLRLCGIVLGPKCAEQEVNIRQIQNMLQRDPELRKLNVEVSESEITNYR